MRKFTPLIIIIVCVFGLFFAGYLTNQHFLLNSGGLHSPSLCSFNALFDCDALNASGFSEIFGYPVSALGITFYLVVILLSLYAHFFQTRMGQVAVFWMIALTFLSLVIDFGLAIIMVLGVGIICVFCVATYIINIIIFFLALLAMPKHVQPEGFIKSLRQAFRYFFFPQRLDEKKSRVFSCVGGIILITILSVLGNVIWGKQISANVQKENQPINLSASDKENLKNQLDALLKQLPKEKGNFLLDQSPSHGSTEAPVVIVEFSDFECPYCKKSADIQKEVVNQNQGKVRVVFKNFPLSPHCNSMVTRDMHPNACLYAYASVCARKQPPYDYFWQMHDVIFEKGKGLDKEGLGNVAKKMGLNKTEFLACLDSEETKKIVQKDLEIGQKLGVNGTPTLFVNGRKLPNPLLPPEVFALMIDVVIEQGL